MNHGTHLNRCGLISSLAGCFLGICAIGSTQAAIQIETKDGRVLTGEVDDRTDSTSLWIRTEQGGIVLATAVSWEDVVNARVEGNGIANDDVSQLVTSAPAAFLTEYEVIDYEQGHPVVPASASIPLARVTALEVDARLVNLDRTVEPDGISLAVAPLDAQGQVVPVCGNVSVRLVGEFFDQFTSRVSFAELESWNATVTESMYGDGLATVNLRFRQIRPEFDLDLCTSALLNVRLGVPGVGNFEASIPLELRTFNPFREQLQYYGGRRFYGNELTRNTRQNNIRVFNRRGLQGY